MPSIDVAQPQTFVIPLDQNPKRRTCFRTYNYLKRACFQYPSSGHVQRLLGRRKYYYPFAQRGQVFHLFPYNLLHGFICSGAAGFAECIIDLEHTYCLPDDLARKAGCVFADRALHTGSQALLLRSSLCTASRLHLHATAHVGGITSTYTNPSLMSAPVAAALLPE